MGITRTLMLMMSNFIMLKIPIIIKQIRVTFAAHVGGGGAYHGNPDPHHLDDDDDVDDEQLHHGEDHDYNQTNWGQIKRRVRGFSLHQSRFRVVAVVPCAEVRCNLGDYHNHHHNYHQHHQHYHRQHLLFLNLPPPGRGHQILHTLCTCSIKVGCPRRLLTSLSILYLIDSHKLSSWLD